MAEHMDTVAAVRRFNRFYTRAIGVLDRAYLGGPYTLAENRVLYEIANGEGVTASHVAATLDLDAGYLSRMLGRLAEDGLVARRRSDTDARSQVLSLTPEGRAYFDGMNARTVAQVETLIGLLSPLQRQRLAGALDTAHSLLDRQAAAGEVVLRPHRAGDMGWVTEHNALIYGEEYGWGPAIEALTARICADFLEHYDPALERCWIAERDGVRLGSVLLVKEPDAPGVARLRLLLLTPEARGLGLGRRLVEACVAFAREAGHREIVLWTHAVLTAARKIYAATGFEIEKTWTHEEFGKTEVSETWRLRL
ncbi:MAG TPA: helix-turn-helix domain-containing GNAT family N-acetyltransferase [Phenylobacterium sp.]|nr:helix-turn-helix domain-containing GNAT family N-acetyltransferase [Phenylobacterium sp.]